MLRGVVFVYGRGYNLRVRTGENAFSRVNIAILERGAAMYEFVKPELLVLIPVLYVIGEIVKNSKVRDEIIPLVLGVAGVIMASLYVIGTAGVSAINVFAGITQGILCAGCAVYGDQIIKQGTGK